MKQIILLVLISSFFYQTKAHPPYCGLTYTYDASGNRIQRDIRDCGGDHGHMHVVDSTSNNQNITETLFPNPTSGLVSIVFNQPVTDANVTITDNLGRQLYSTTASGSSIPLDMSRFAQGVYYIVVRTQDNKYQSSVVKE